MWNKSDIQGSRADEAPDEKSFIRWLGSPETELADIALKEKITAILSWDYPYIDASRVPAKVSVTELKRRFDSVVSEDAGALPESLPVLIKRPKFMEDRKGLSSAEAGTVLHFVMQHLDLRQGIGVQIREMISKELLTEQQAQSVDTVSIQRFIASPLADRMLAAGSINREVPFNMEIPCNELYRDIGGKAWKDETVLLQGVIDCYFEEPDGIVLLDYKTDYVPAGKTEIIRERYRLQISYYARALEMLTGKKVKGSYIYLFRNGEVLEM